MSDDIREIIPGYRAALEREDAIRSESFLGVSELICGAEVKPFTLDHLCRLQCVGSPFVRGGVPEPEDVAVFLWCVSPEYNPAAWFRRYWFTRKVAKLSYEASVKAIGAYLDESFCDAPTGGSAGFTPPNWSNYASIVGNLAAEFGWSESDIMNMPLKRVWQYYRVAVSRSNPNAVFSNRISEKKRREWMDGQQVRTE